MPKGFFVFLEKNIIKVQEGGMKLNKRSSNCIQIDPNRTYEVFTVTSNPLNDKDRGTLYLHHVERKSLECFTVRKIADSFYVSLPTGVNGELTDFDVAATFQINPVIFDEPREFM